MTPALESGKPAFTWLWDAISTSGQIYLAAIAHLHAENEKANKDVIQTTLDTFRIRRGADWSSVPRELADWDILRDNSGNNLQFVVRLMEFWVQESHGLREMKAALTQEGDGDFKKARALIQAGQSEQAVKALRDLLTINPNHLGAQLALARLLLDQKRVKEAVDAFEDAFWLDEDVGRDGLIDARLAMAMALEENQQYVEAALHYRRVLQLRRDEYRVQEKLRVLYDQGRKAAAAGDWDKAARYLERVTDIDKTYKDAHERRDSAYHKAKTASQPLEPVIATAPASPSTTLRALVMLSSAAVLLLFLGGVGGWFILNGLVLASPTATQAIALASETPLNSPTFTSTPEPTQTPALTSTALPAPSDTPTAPPADTPTSTPTAPPTDTPTPTPTGYAYPYPNRHPPFPHPLI
ncbi:MAG: tetratricopeptide repeat protein, partial [Anaerolineales bacterium]|nr:tetratricopeptide repeat protein [Anaerolineales bacterium]